MIQSFLLLLLLIFISILSFFLPRNYDDFSLFLIMLIALIGLIFHLSRNETHQELKKQYLKISNLFLLGYLIVGFQNYIDLLLGNNNLSDYELWVNPNNIVYSASVVTAGLLSYLIGNSYTFNVSNRNSYYQPKFTNLFLLKLLLTFVVIVFFATVNKEYLFGGYALGVEMGPVAKYMALIFHGVIFSIIILHTRNVHIKEKSKLTVLNYIKSYGLLVVLSTLFYLIGVLISGDRGPIITIVMGFTIGYVYLTNIKIKAKLLIIIGFMAAIVITFLGRLRAIVTEETFTDKLRVLFAGQDLETKKSFLQPTKELAGSINTVHYVINYIPEKYGFFYGKFQLLEIRDSIPFLTGFIKNSGYIIAAEDKSISDYITWLAQGDYATYGNGSSIIADFYTAFGIISVIISMFVFGVFIRTLDVELFKKRQLSVVMQTTAFVYFANSIYISRSYALDSFKLIFMVLIIIFINKIMVIASKEIGIGLKNQ